MFTIGKLHKFIAASTVTMMILSPMPISWAASTEKPATITTTPTSTDKAEIQKRFVENLAAIGVTFTQDGENIDVIVDQKKAVAAIPVLESQGVIPKIATEDVKKSPLALSVGVIGISFTIVIMNMVFTENPSMKEVKVQTYVLPSENKEKQLCFSFNYTRDMFNKMNLDTLTPKDFVVNTSGFTFSQWCRTNMEKESKSKK